MPTINPYQTSFSPFAGIQGQGYSSPAASVDPSTALFDTALGIGGTIFSNNQQQAGANGAIGMAGFNPTGISGPNGIGGVTSDGSGGYNLSGPTSGPFAGFNNLAGNGINYASGNVGANPFDTASSGTLSAFNNFDPTKFASDEYGQLTAAAAPGMTDQTQAMLNYEQASGRGGVTQNGQLGDVGGLALAQQTADTQRRLASIADARNQGGYLAGLATTFANQGNTQRAAAMNTGTTGLEGLLGVNSSLQQLLASSIGASTARANAGANQGQFRYLSGVNSGNNFGNLFGGAQQGINAAGGIGNVASGIGKLFGYGGGGSNVTNDINNINASTGFDPNNPMGNFNYIGDSNPDSVFTGGGFNSPDSGNYLIDPSSFGPGPPSAAGGEAAAPGVGNAPSAGFGGYSETSNPSTPSAGSNPFAAIGNAAGDVNNALSIYQGLQRGGISGYGSAAVNAGSLASKAGMLPSGANQYLGPLGAGLGLYNGLKTGGVMGYTNAALSAAQLAGAASSAGLLGSGAAASTAATAGGFAAGAAAPIAAFAALYGLDQKQSELSPLSMAEQAFTAGKNMNNAATQVRAGSTGPNGVYQGYGVSQSDVADAQSESAAIQNYLGNLYMHMSAAQMNSDADYSPPDLIGGAIGSSGGFGMGQGNRYVRKS